MVSQDAVTPGSAAHPSGAQVSSGFELGDVLRILTERRKWIVGAGLAGLVLGLLVSLLMTPLYRATALLELNSPANEVLDTAGGGDRGSGQRGSSQEMLATQVGLLESETLARRVVEDLNLVSAADFGGAEGTRQQRAGRAAARVMAGTTVEPVKGSLLIQVGFSSPDPGQAAKIANALATGFISSSLERRYDSSSYARDFLRDQLARTKKALEDSERHLNAYAIESGVFRTPGQVVDGRSQEGATMSVLDLTALNTALNDAKVKRINAEQAFRNAGLASVANQSANVNALFQKRSELQAQYDEKALVFKADYPQMRELAASIARIDSTIASEGSRASGARAGELRAEYEAARQTETELAAQVAASKGDVLIERGRSIEYNILQREADTNRALYDALLQRFKEIGVAGGIGQSNVSVVDQADVPRGPYSPNLPVNAIVGLLAGLAAGVGLAFAMHLLFDNVIDPADVRRKLHLPVLGVIPMEQEDRSLMEALTDKKSDVSEAYYSLRTALTFIRKEGPPSSLLVTSTQPGEGKSTTSYAIARNMARAGKRVLLIDADLRKPTFVSAREDGHGLAYLLGADEPLGDYIQQTQEEKLSLLPVGRFVGSAAELLSSTRLPIIVNEARASFDMVVVDGPPVLGLTDAPLLGSVAECTLYVVQSRANRTVNIVEMIRRLSESGTEMLGVVLTKVTRSAGHYGYDYYTYNYGGDGDVGGAVSSDPARKLDLAPQRLT